MATSTCASHSASAGAPAGSTVLDGTCQRRSAGWATVYREAPDAAAAASAISRVPPFEPAVEGHQPDLAGPHRPLDHIGMGQQLAPGDHAGGPGITGSSLRPGAVHQVAVSRWSRSPHATRAPGRAPTRSAARPERRAMLPLTRRRPAMRAAWAESVPWASSVAVAQSQAMVRSGAGRAAGPSGGRLRHRGASM